MGYLSNCAAQQDDNQPTLYTLKNLATRNLCCSITFSSNFAMATGYAEGREKGEGRAKRQRKDKNNNSSIIITLRHCWKHWQDGGSTNCIWNAKRKNNKNTLAAKLSVSAPTQSPLHTHPPPVHPLAIVLPLSLGCSTVPCLRLLFFAFGSFRKIKYNYLMSTNLASGGAYFKSSTHYKQRKWSKRRRRKWSRRNAGGAWGGTFDSICHAMTRTCHR